MLVASSVSNRASWGQRTEALEPPTAPVLAYSLSVWGGKDPGLTHVDALSCLPCELPDPTPRLTWPNSFGKYL